jgi:asparagine synthase (glutamine-hydrolysing)
MAAERKRRVLGRPALSGTDFDFPRPAWLRGEFSMTEVEPPPGTNELSAAKANQVLGITYWADAVDREHRNPHRPIVYPLLSQPLVELALRAPVPSLVDHSGDRLLLRRAMRGRLPGEITGGAPKGSYVGVYQRALRRNSAIAKELIVDGRCAAVGLVDSALALEDLRATALGFVVGPNWPLYSLLAVELWCRSWVSGDTVAR